MKRVNESYENANVNENEILLNDIKYYLQQNPDEEIKLHLDNIKSVIYKSNTVVGSKDTLSKDYNDLTIADKDNIIKALGLDKNTSKYKAKEDFITSMCRHIEEDEYFNVKGKTMPKLVCEIDISKNLTSEQAACYIIENLKNMRIRPKCAFITDGWSTLDFHPREYYHFNHWSCYLRTVIDFITYLEELEEIGIELTYRDPFEPGLAREIKLDAETISGSIFTEEFFNDDTIEFYGRLVGELKY